MATVIDALVVTLGLDPAKFKQGQKDARHDLDKTRKESERTAKEMERYGKQAAAFFTQIRNEALTMFAVLAIGGGLKSFVTDTIHSAAQLGFMSENLGMSTKHLSAWQKAAERAGGTAQGMTAQLVQSQQAAAQYHNGMTDDSTAWFFRYGGDANALKDGNSYLLARAKIIHDMYQQDRGKAALAAGQMGITPEMFNLMKQGPGAILALVAAQEKNAVITDAQAKKALALENRWRDIRDEFRGTAIEVLFTLMPVMNNLTAAIKKGADWVVTHRDEIKAWVELAVAKIKEFSDTANNAAQAVGGWKNVLVGLLALKLLSFTSQLLGMAAALGKVGSALNATVVAGSVGWMIGSYIRGQLNPETQDFIGEHVAQVMEVFGSKDAHNVLEQNRRGKRADYLMQQLSYAGYTPAQAAGIVGSLTQESGLSPSIVNPKSGAAGIGQWLGPRAQQFRKMFGSNVADASFEDQVKFLIWEMNNTHKRAGTALHHARTADEAAVMHRKLYEIPDPKEANDLNRIAYARELLQWYKPINVAAAGSNHVASETHIGKIEVHTRATDATGIARDIGPAIQNHHLVAQANGGLN